MLDDRCSLAAARARSTRSLGGSATTSEKICNAYPSARNAFAQGRCRPSSARPGSVIRKGLAPRNGFACSPSRIEEPFSKTTRWQVLKVNAPVIPVLRSQPFPRPVLWADMCAFSVQAWCPTRTANLQSLERTFPGAMNRLETARPEFVGSGEPGRGEATGLATLAAPFGKGQQRAGKTSARAVCPGQAVGAAEHPDVGNVAVPVALQPDAPSRPSEVSAPAGRPAAYGSRQLWPPGHRWPQRTGLLRSGHSC